MNKIVKIKRAISNAKVEISKFKGISEENIFNQKGIFSKPLKEEDGLSIELLNSSDNDVIIPKQKEININEGDVVITNNKGKILFKYSDNSLIIEAENIIFKATNVKFEGGSISHDGKSIDKNHIHKYQQQAKPMHSIGSELPKKTEKPS